MDLVSVIIPTYNRSNTILKCIKSVLEQTYQNIEIIVVDDASVDNTEMIVKEIKDRRVKYFRYDVNRGACFARNYGVMMSKGNYIAFQDSDDTWVPNKIERQLSFLNENNADFVFCGMTRTDQNKSFYFPTYVIDYGNDLFQQILSENPISTQTMFMKREIFDKVKFDISFKRFQDWDFSLQVANSGFKILFLDEPLVFSEVSPNSISSNGKTAEAYEHLYNKYKEKFECNAVALSNYYLNMARCSKNDRKRCIKFLLLSLRNSFKLKTFIKLILKFFYLWN